MGSPKTGRLRVHGQGGVRLSEIREFLADLEHAYSAVYAIEVIVDGSEQLAHELERAPWPPRVWIPQLFWAAAPGARGRSRYLVSWPPAREEVATVVAPRHRLVLGAVELGSPGAWDFIGKLNPLDVVRQYLCDRHERRKDKEYREAAERQRLELENRLLEGKVLKEKIDIAKSLGATEADLAPLLSELVHGPLRALGRHQDQGVIDAAEFVLLDSPHDQSAPKK